MQIDDFLEAELKEQYFHQNSLKCIGFTCKANNGKDHLVWSRFHFLLIFIDEMAFQGWSVKVPKTYNSLKSVGNMYKNYTSHL